MSDLQAMVASTYTGLADVLADAPVETWDAPTLCAGWRVRHVVAHVTMPTRLTPERFGAEMAAAHGDFTRLSNTIAARDASLPLSDHLDALRSSLLHDWQPPGGGPAGALSHAVSTPSTSPWLWTVRRSLRRKPCERSWTPSWRTGHRSASTCPGAGSMRPI